MVGRTRIGILVVSLLLVGAVYADGGYFIQQDGPDALICIEAENFAANQAGEQHTWELTTEPAGFSGKGALVAMPDEGINEDIDYGDSPNTDYKVNFVKTGKHYVWVRGYGVSNGNSIHMDLDHRELETAQEMDLATNQWQWNNEGDDDAAYLEIKTPGEHIISLCMREDGAMVDKIILTTNPDYKPEGTGPVESTKGGIMFFESKASGNRETIPAKIMSEMPFPMPLSVICSPSHMINAVPVVRVIIVSNLNPQPGSATTAPNVLD